MYGLFKGASDCESGYYFYNDSSDSIRESIIELCMDLINQYCHTEYSPDDIVGYNSDEDKDDKYYDGFYTEFDGLVALINGDEKKLENFSFCISDSDIHTLAFTNDEKELFDACADIDEDLVEGKSGVEAAEAIVNEYTTWM